MEFMPSNKDEKIIESIVGLFLVIFIALDALLIQYLKHKKNPPVSIVDLWINPDIACYFSLSFCTSR